MMKQSIMEAAICNVPQCNAIPTSVKKQRWRTKNDLCNFAVNILTNISLHNLFFTRKALINEGNREGDECYHSF